MKKIGFVVLLTVGFISGCAKSDDNYSTRSTKSTDDKSVVLYFSKPEMDGTDAVAGASRVISDEDEVVGNTEQLAMWIGEDTDSTVAQIETVETYPDNHETLVDQATEERSEDKRPELKPLDVDLSDYNTLYIGYPIWWSDMPMAVYTFFDDNDLSGKTIFLFSSHGGSGLAGTVESIVKLEPDATIDSDNVLSISRDDISASRSEVDQWVQTLK